MSLSLQQIDEGIDALLVNASQLVNEARALLSIHGYARAFALAHLAREELSKVVMLHAAAIRLLAEHPVDWKRLMTRLRDHKAKLKLEQVENALLLQGLTDDPAHERLLATAVPAAEYRNDQKNASLYVGFEEGRFSIPADQFNEHKASRTVRLAELRLQELQFDRERLARYSEREIGSLRGMKNFDQLSPAELREVLPAAAKLFALIARCREQPSES